MIDDLNRRIDLLVDGELPESEQRSLLARLDETATGWRRCALAFLESQAWQDELNGNSAIPPSNGPSLNSLALRRFYPNNWARTLLAIAATFVAAFVLGWQLNTPSLQSTLANKDSSPHLNKKSESTSRDGTRTVPSISFALYDEPSNQRRELRLPVVMAEEADIASLPQLPDMIPAEVIEQLDEHRVPYRHRREYWPFQLPDGGRLIVPVDQLHVLPVGYSSYQ